MKKMVIPIIAGVVLIIGIILFLLLKKSDSYYNIGSPLLRVGKAQNHT